MGDDSQLPGWFQVFREENNRRLDSQDGKLGEILKEAKRTNGRVTDLEQRNVHEDGERAAGETVEGRHQQYLERRHAKRLAMLTAVLTVPAFLAVDWIAKLLHLV